MDVQAQVRENVKELLVFTHRTQVALAKHMELSQPQVSLLINGKRNWQLADLDRLANFFCVTVPSLLTSGSRDRRLRPDRRSGIDRRREGI